MLVVEVKSVGLLVVVDVLLEEFSNIFPLSNESLTLWGSKEGLVELLDVLHLFGVEPSLEGCLKVSDWCRVLDLHGNVLDVSGFSLDGSLSSWGD